MPKEVIIKKKAINILEKAGWIVWYPSKIKYKQNDIFGVIDLLALKGRQKKNIQLTTFSNLSARRKKIIRFFKKFKVQLLIEIWAWNSIKKTFKIEKLNYLSTQVKNKQGKVGKKDKISLSGRKIK